MSFPLLNAEVPALTTDAPIWMSEGTNEPVLLRAFTRVATGEALIDPIGLCLCPSNPLWSSCRVSCSEHLVFFFFFFCIVTLRPQQAKAANSAPLCSRCQALGLACMG